MFEICRTTVRWPEVTASAKKRTSVEEGGTWDPFLLRLLENAFTSASLVVLVVDTVAMAERWWPKWGELLKRELTIAKWEMPRVLGGLIQDDLHDLVTVLSRRGAAPHSDQGEIAPMVKAFLAWARRPRSRLILLAPLKDSANLVFSPVDATATSLSRMVALSREFASKVETFVCCIRRSFRDYVELQRAVKALANDTKCTVYVATPISEKDADFPKVHPPFQTAVRFWLQGRMGDITPRCASRPYGRPTSSAAAITSNEEETDGAGWGNPASEGRCRCSSSSKGIISVFEGGPIHGRKGT